MSGLVGPSTSRRSFVRRGHVILVIPRSLHSTMSSTGGGIVAALSAPFLLDVGFLIWDKHWKGSSFALNLYKCTLASIGFLILSFATRPPGAALAYDDATSEHSGRGPAFPPELFTVQAVGFLMLSSTIGILIGDWTWLEALQLCRIVVNIEFEGCSEKFAFQRNKG